jgi:hypothetical protein
MAKSLLSASGERKILVLVLAFAGISGALVLYPTDQSLKYAPVQSVEAIDNITVFAALMTLWAGILLALISQVRNAKVVGATLAVAFVLLYLGFWPVHRPYGMYEEWAKLSDSVAIQAHGSIPQEKVRYLQWPAVAILGATLSDVSGVEPADLRLAILLANQAALALTLFALLSKILASIPLAVLGVILATVANSHLAMYHVHPALLALPLLAGFLLMCAQWEEPGKNTVGSRFVAIILGAGMTMMHFVTSMVPFLLLSAWYILRRRSGGGVQRPVNMSTLALFLLMPAAWLMYWATAGFNMLTEELWRSVQAGLQESVWYILRVGEANVSPAPFWASVTRLGWLVGLYGLGVLLSCWAILKGRKAPPRLVWVSGGVLGLVALALIATALSTGGNQFYRFITYSSFFAAPVILLWMTQSRLGAKAISVLGLLVVLSMAPTFLANNTRVSDMAYYPWEVAVAKFLREALPRTSTTLYDQP